jgi:hypothetical protein
LLLALTPVTSVTAGGGLRPLRRLVLPAPAPTRRPAPTRHPHADDRRKNVVELTAPGRDTLRDATQAADDAERRFLTPLTEPAAEQLKDALGALLTQPDR